METTIAFLIVLNFSTFLFCGLDKQWAIKGKRRIQESLLLFLSMLGGCFGCYIGMYVFHHKTNKPKFKYGIPCLLLLWSLLFLLIVIK